MLTKTSLSGIRALLYLGLQGRRQPVSPRNMAQQLGESPTYLAKVVRLLARAGILQAHRGVAGGMVLNRSPEDITLRAIVEACQGTVLGDFCSDTPDLKNACGLHQAGAELHAAIIGVLSRWTLADLLRKPCPNRALEGNTACWLEPLRELLPDRAPRRVAAANRRQKTLSIPQRG